MGKAKINDWYALLLLHEPRYLELTNIWVSYQVDKHKVGLLCSVVTNKLLAS